jgi:multidrug efflux pump subunit AcrB
MPWFGFASMIMMAIPFGIIGAIFGHLFMGYSLTMLSLFGLVALSGIVVNNSLLIIAFINSAIESGKTPAKSCYKRLYLILDDIVSWLSGSTPANDTPDQ